MVLIKQYELSLSNFAEQLEEFPQTRLQALFTMVGRYTISTGKHMTKHPEKVALYITNSSNIIG